VRLDTTLRIVGWRFARASARYCEDFVLLSHRGAQICGARAQFFIILLG